MEKTVLQFSDYIANLVNSMKDKRSKKNTQSLISKIFSHQSIQLWRLSADSKEYERYHNLINGKMVNTLNLELLNSNLLINSIQCLQGQLRVIVIHDESEIRKPESSKLENLGWVQSLEGKMIRGYKTFNSIMIDNQDKTIKLLCSTPYSNQDPQFLSKKEFDKYEKGKLNDQAREKEIDQLLEKQDYYHSKTICLEQIEKIHNQIKAINPDIIIIHILDRGFDCVEVFEFIESLGDKFVIRFKSNRNANEKIINDKGKEVFLKLASKTFENIEKVNYSKVCFRDKAYKNATGVFEWDTTKIKNELYNVQKVRFVDEKNRKIFASPMLLISNYQLSDLEMVQYVYQLYMQRTKIEGTFKFLKDILGWEEFRIHDYESIKNLIVLAFFVGGYFYEIEHELTKDYTVQWICKLGNGKGKVTKYYFMEGLKILIQMALFDKFCKENNISPEDIELAYKKFAP